jgi:hypothetical protein
MLRLALYVNHYAVCKSSNMLCHPAQNFAQYGIIPASDRPGGTQ